MTSHRTYNPGPPTPLASDNAGVNRAKFAAAGVTLGSRDTKSTRDKPSAPHKATYRATISDTVVFQFQTAAQAQAFAAFIEKTSAIWASQNPRDVVTFPHGRPGFATINHPPKTEF